MRVAVVPFELGFCADCRNLMVVYSRYTLWTTVLGLCSIFSVDNYDYLGDNYVLVP